MYLLIDEVQKLEEWAKVINVLGLALRIYRKKV
jgi:predicted AAA+ superfamily ATPase